ncbi:MAG: hypothetical protein AABY16_04135 [Nanoarchaeota archaeon]
MRLRLIFIVGIFVLLPLASAGIFIEPLNEIYNYGDQLTIRTNLIPSSATAGHYIVDLKCGANLTINIFNQFFNLQPGVEQPVQITTQLTNPLLSNLSSSCYLFSNFGSDVASSSSFALSKIIIVELELEFDELAPGKKISVSGSAIKESGVSLNGFVELSVPSLNLYKSTAVSNGIVNISTLIPENSKSGKHNITVEVHDTSSSGNVMNTGGFSDEFNVKQILKEIEISAVDEEIEPGKEEFVFQIVTRDQAGDPILKEINILVSDPRGLPFIKKIVKSNENQKMAFSLNNTPGYWAVEVTLDDFTERKLFYVAEVRKLQTSLINDTLIVTNIGNTPYKGPLEVTIGSFVEVKQISLDVGETKKFNLEAPDGTYSISVADASESQVLGSTFLTGNAIKVSDLREDLLDTIKNPIIWWIAAILFVLIVVLVQVKLRLQHRPPSAPLGASKNVELPVKKVGLDKPAMTVSEPSETRQNWSSSSSTLIGLSRSTPPTSSRIFADTQTGARERAVVIALRANMAGNSAYAGQAINSSLSLAQEANAKIYIDGDFKIILFSPRLTKSNENAVLAVQTAKRIESLLAEHNKLYQNKINFGIGIHEGDIISEIENGVFHFTSVGNVISAAKRIAQNATMKTLLTEAVKSKVSGNVKLEKSATSPSLWEITRVIDRTKSEEFLRRFTARNK